MTKIKHSKRFVFTTVLFLLLGVMLTACTQTSETSDQVGLNSIPLESETDTQPEAIYQDNALIDCVIGLRNNNSIQNEMAVKSLIKTLFNLNVEFRYYSWDEDPEILFTGENAVDLLLGLSFNIEYYSQKEYLENLNNYRTELDSYIAIWNSADTKTNNHLVQMSEDMGYGSCETDEWYCATSVFRNIYPNSVWFYRKDIFEANNLEFPENAEDILKTVQVLKTDEDIYPILSYDNWLLNGLYSAYRIEPGFYYNSEKNEFGLGCTEENWKNAVMTYSQLCGEELVTTRPGSYDDTDFGMAITYGPVMYLNYLLDINENWVVAETAIKNRNTDSAYIKVAGDFYSGMCINNNSDSVLKKRLAELINWTITEEGINRTWFGEEGQSFTYKDEKIKLKGSEIRWLSPNHIAVNKYGNDVLNMYSLGGVFRMMTPDWHNNYYKDEPRIKCYMDAALQVENLATAYSISFDTTDIWYNDYTDIMTILSEFTNRLGNAPIETILELENFLEEIRKTEYKEILDYIKAEQ